MNFKQFVETNPDWDKTTIMRKGDMTPKIASPEDDDLMSKFYNLAYRMKRAERDIAILQSKTPLEPEEKDPKHWVR